MSSPRKPRGILAVHGLLRYPSRLPTLGPLVRTTLYSYAFNLIQAWAKPAFTYAGIASLCLFIYTTLSIHSICYSMTETMTVSAKIGMPVVRTVARLVFVRGRQQRFPNWTLQLGIMVDALWLVAQQCGTRVSESWVASELRNRSMVLGTIEGYIASYLCGDGRTRKREREGREMVAGDLEG